MTDKRYLELKRLAYEIYKKYNIRMFPIDMFEVFEKIGIKLIKYSEINEYPEIKLIYKASQDAQYLPYLNVVVYNDKIESKGRIQNSLAHELCHIMRKHRCQSKLAEEEARFFARYFRVPQPIVDILEPSSYIEIKEFFLVSKQSAEYAYRNYLNRRKRKAFVCIDKELYDNIQNHFYIKGGDEI